MKYVFILFILLMMAGAASAQDYVIKLNAKEDTTLKKRSFYFSAVTDNREEAEGKRIVGHFGKNNKNRALLEKDLEPFLLDYLAAAYPKHHNEQPYTLRVNVLECSSEGGMFSEAKVRVDLDVVNDSTGLFTNLTLEQTRQPLMGGKTFGLLMEEILASAVKMIKPEQQGKH